MSIVDSLTGLHVFQGVPREAIEELYRLAPAAQFPAEAIVIREGDVADRALLVVEGRLRAFVKGGRHPRKLGSVRPGEIVGEAGLYVTGGSRNASVQAVEPSTCLVLTPDAVRAAERNAAMHAIERHLLRVMARRIRRTNKTIREAWAEAQQDEAQGREGPTLRERLRGLFRRSS